MLREAPRAAARPARRRGRDGHAARRRGTAVAAHTEPGGASPLAAPAPSGSLITTSDAMAEYYLQGYQAAAARALPPQQHQHALRAGGRGRARVSAPAEAAGRRRAAAPMPGAQARRGRGADARGCVAVGARIARTRQPRPRGRCARAARGHQAQDGAMGGAAPPPEQQRLRFLSPNPTAPLVVFQCASRSGHAPSRLLFMGGRSARCAALRAP